MKRRATRTLKVLALAGVLMLLPLQALAAVCFNTSPGIEILVIEVVGQGGQFFSLVGESVNWCGTGTSMPLSGSAHIRSDGKAHFGLSVHGPVGTCPPGWYQGTLDPPNFNTGSGFVQVASGPVFTVTFVAVPCPLLPE